jgi:FtsP/CotA-like multicopper oxidase with cupredoxin domain
VLPYIGMAFCRKRHSKSFQSRRGSSPGGNHNLRWMDGVPGVQQCPIPPGGSFTYSFIADLYGTSWYHSHYSAQYAGGLIGPMVIHGPQTIPYDIGMSNSSLAEDPTCGV